jgi:hypothetical protein
MTEVCASGEILGTRAVNFRSCTADARSQIYGSDLLTGMREYIRDVVKSLSVL